MAQVFSQVVYDAYQYYGNDIQYSATNDIQLASDIDRSQQRVLRRLFTNPGDYIWHPEYGAGLPLYIGQPLSPVNIDQLQTIITSQMYLEDSVAQTPAPVINIQTTQFGLFIQITYMVNPSQQSVVLSFPVSR